MNTEKINIGVIGCANIAEKYIVPALMKSEKFKIIGVASRAKEKADRFAFKYSTKAYYNYDSLVNDPKIQAVYIPLPNSLHFDWILKALKNNLHVLVEKSMSCSFEEVLELNNFAKSNKLVLIENFQFRFHSQLSHIKNLVNNGAIGEVRNVRSSFGFPPFADKKNIRYNKDLGGGALLDAGAYPIKISQFFLGEDIIVDSASLYYQADINVDTWGSACLKQKNGILSSQISFGFDNFYQNNIELWGNKGKIYTNRIFTAPPGFEPSIELETPEGKQIIKLPGDDHFINMLNHFHSQIKTKTELDLEYSQNINQARLISELFKQAR